MADDARPYRTFTKSLNVAKALTSLVVLRDAMHQGMVTDDRPPKSLDFYVELNRAAADILARHADKSPKHWTNADEGPKP